MVSLENMLNIGALSLMISGCEPTNYPPGAQPLEIGLKPVYASTHDDLHCQVEGMDGPFDFYWSVSSLSVYGERSYSSTLDHKHTISGDLVECSAWTPGSSWVDSFEVGYERILIE